MQTDYIILREYSRKTNVDPGFLISLEETGLINIFIDNGEKYFPASQLVDMERYTRMYYDLSINTEGIDVINHMLGRMKDLQQEIEFLRSKLRIYESENHEDGLIEF